MYNYPILFFRFSLPTSTAQNGRLSSIDVVSFTEIQSNFALPRGGGICGSAHYEENALSCVILSLYTFRIIFKKENEHF